MLTQEQSREIKKKIISQLESTLPQDKKEETISYIESLDSDQLEEFLKRNKLTAEQDGEQNIFRMIVEGKIPSYKIAENEEAIAVLEINPQSLGHVIIIPKYHVMKIDEMKGLVHDLAKEVSKHIKTKLRAKEVKIVSAVVLNNALINVIPVYDNGTRLKEKPSPEDLQKLQEKLLMKEKVKKVAKSKASKKSPSKEIHYKMPRRVP